MPPQQKRLVYIGLAALIAVIFAAGLISGYVDRHKPLCPDGRPPKSQQDTGLNQVMYLCHNGQVITK